MPEWLKGADCKSAAFRYVGSNPTRPNFYLFVIQISFLINVKYYKATILFKIRDNTIMNKTTNIITTTRDCGFLNKFRKGVIITNTNPSKLLIKNLGYLRIFVQKSFIKKISLLLFI